MKKASLGQGDKAVKKDSGVEDVERYLDALPEPARGTLGKVRESIRKAAGPDATEFISYSMPAFKRERTLVSYAAFSDHCSFFPMNSSLIQEFRDELAGYSTSKGTIRFPLDKPLPETLIAKMVRARVAENKQKRTR